MCLVLLEGHGGNTDVHGVQIETGLGFSLLEVVEHCLAHRPFILNIGPAAGEQKHRAQQTRNVFHFPIIPVAVDPSPAAISVSFNGDKMDTGLNKVRSAVPLVAVLVCVAPASRAVEIPTGTELQIRLTTPVAASAAKVGQAVKSVLIAPVFVGGQLAIPSGVVVEGQVKQVHASTAANDAASLLLNFDRVRDTKGTSAALDALVVGIDNARESVDGSGRVNGILASNTASGRMDSGIAKVSDKYPTFAELLKDFKGAVLKEADSDINYPAGVELTLRLNKALAWNGPAGNLDLKPIEPQAALAALVNVEPYRTTAQSPPSPSDMTNLMFLGTEEQLQAAFHAAGWASAAALDGKSKLETFRALAENRSYDEAPVSILLLDRRPPDLVFQKQNNTFAQRHHLRIWRRPETFQGRPVWVCAATHDIGIDFSRESRTFTHKVDTQIDRERSKVVNDLLFTGKVQALSLVERPAVPKTATNATGDQLITDGNMAVLEF